jgi:hypothetical protein
MCFKFHLSTRKYEHVLKGGSSSHRSDVGEYRAPLLGGASGAATLEHGPMLGPPFRIKLHLPARVEGLVVLGKIRHSGWLRQLMGALWRDALQGRLALMHWCAMAEVHGVQTPSLAMMVGHVMCVVVMHLPTMG